MSSPLASMHPAPLGQNDIFGNRFARQRPVFFNLNLKVVPGSSPATSLAADLSQNFHIDNEASPRFPTPRRALFTGQTITGAESRRVISTPSLHSSSPMAFNESMEMDISSPLPHKQRFSAQVEVLSPTEISPLDETSMTESELLAPSPPILESARSSTSSVSSVVERRKSIPRRPSLSLARCYSTSEKIRYGDNNQLPVFRFGGGVINKQAPTRPQLSLDECFGSNSPPRDPPPQSADSPTPGMAPQRPVLTGVGGTGTGKAGVINHTRRPSNPFKRPRKQMRRTLSMFESPKDVMKAVKEEIPCTTALQAVADVEEPHDLRLPHFFVPSGNDSIPRITRETFLQVLDGKFSDHYEQKMVIDCRFEYEYDGGHIDGAINYNDKKLLASHLFRSPLSGRTMLIFHCEYSAHRAPMMARHVRSEDRAVNAEFYPRLTYPEVYILDGGYSGFFAEHRSRCYPQSYVEMSAAEHVNTCEREMGKLKGGSKVGTRRTGLFRAKTYACGPRGTLDDIADDSPTAPGRVNPRESSDDLFTRIAGSPILGADRCHARRMASY